MVVGIIRVSTARQDHGRQAQLDALTRWCEARGAELLCVHEDIGVSGGTAIDKRPGLMAALDALRVHGAGVLLAAKRDRLARDTVIAAVLERVVESHGAVVQTADGIAAGVSPEDKLLRTMIDAVSEFERALIRARTKAALAAKKSKGQRVGGIPYGYRIADDGARVVRDAHEQNTIRRLKRLRRTRSLRELAAYCDAHSIWAFGRDTPRGRRSRCRDCFGGKRRRHVGSRRGAIAPSTLGDACTSCPASPSFTSQCPV